MAGFRPAGAPRRGRPTPAQVLGCVTGSTALLQGHDCAGSAGSH